MRDFKLYNLSIVGIFYEEAFKINIGVAALIAKKLLYLLAFSFLSTTCFANECMDHFKDHWFGAFMDFNSCQLTDKDVTAIVKFANNHPGIQSLYAGDNSITDEGVRELSLLNPFPDELGLAKNAIQGKTLASLKNLNLISISLEDNPLDNESVKELLLNKQIKGLSIGSDKLQDDIANIISSRDFDFLGIEGNGISENEWQNIAEFSRAKFIIIGGKNIRNSFGKKLANNSFVEGLYIKDYAMDAYGFAQAFSNPHIHFLETSHINDNSAFLEALANSQYINALDIFPAEEDILLNERIGKLLGKNKSITDLEISSSLIRKHKTIIDAGFARAISTSNISDVAFYSTNININDDAAIAFAENHHLKSLGIGNGQITDAGAIALERSVSLTELTLRRNQVTDVGALAFIDNVYLDSLDLRYNPISYTAANKLKANSKIKNIYIDLRKTMPVMKTFKVEKKLTPYLGNKFNWGYRNFERNWLYPNKGAL